MCIRLCQEVLALMTRGMRTLCSPGQTIFQYKKLVRRWLLENLRARSRVDDLPAALYLKDISPDDDYSRVHVMYDGLRSRIRRARQYARKCVPLSKWRAYLLSVRGACLHCKAWYTFLLRARAIPDAQRII